MPYTPSEDRVVQEQSRQISIVLANNPGSPEAGRSVYKSLMDQPDLTERQKQAICCEVGRSMVQNGIEQAGDHPELMLRQDSAATAFMTAAMKEMTPDYFEAVAEDAMEVAARQAPDGAQQAAEALVGSLTTQKHRLTADACQFMEACKAGIPEDLDDATKERIKGRFAVNTILLRGVNTLIANARAAAINPDLNASQQHKDATRTASQASMAVQKFANYMPVGFEVPENDALDMSRPEHVVAAALMANEGLRDQFVETMQQIADGNRQQLQVGAPQPFKDTVKARLGRDDESKLEAAGQKLQQRKDKLAAFTGQRNANQQQLQAKQQFATNVAADGNNELSHKTQNSIGRLQEKSVKLDAKIQSQQEKVERSEARVDRLQSRIGRR
jgi:hypothetical protein